MRRLLLLTLVFVALPGAGEAPAAIPEHPPLPAERDRSAFCLRATGAPGALATAAAASARRDDHRLGTRLLLADAERFAPDAAAPIRTEGCGTVATAAGGVAVAAGWEGVAAGRRHRLRAAVRDAGGAFAAPVTLARGPARDVRLAAAAGADGTAVVVWVQGRRLKRPAPNFPGWEARVMAARRSPGAGFSRPQALTPWADASSGASTRLAAGIDAAGRIVVAWSIPTGSGDAFEIPPTTRVGVAWAARDGRFGAPQTLRERVEDTDRLALAVAPDGEALLAFDGGEVVRTFEASPGGPFSFTGEVGGGRRGPATDPAVALRDGGGAALTWRDGDGGRTVWVRTRERAGPFGPTRALVPARGSESLGVSVSLISPEGLVEGPDNFGPHIAVAGDGRAVVTWVDRRRAPDGDRLPAARVAVGSLGGGFGAAEWLGSRCRAASSVAALLLAGGEPAAAFADNRSTSPFGRGDFEFPVSRGRLHVAFPRRSAPAVPAERPPRVTLRARPQALFHDQPLEIEARCDGPCDLRGRPASGRGVGSAALRRAGTVKLRIEPGFGRHFAPRRRARIPVVVHACSPAVDVLTTARITVPVRRRRPPPLPRVLGLRARRDGKAVRVSWRTDRPAYRLEFFVTGRRERRGESAGFEQVEARGRRRFSARLRGRRLRYVVLRVQPQDPGRRARIRVAGIR